MKYTPKTLPTPIDLMTLPCIRCVGKATTLVSDKEATGGLFVPVCGACCIVRLPEDKHAALRKLAHHIDLLAASGDRMGCCMAIAVQRGGIFGEMMQLERWG